MRHASLVLAAVLALLPLSVARPRAEVVESSASGFTIKFTAHVAAAPTRAYETVVKIGTWWNNDHTYSGSAANMTIDPRAGGCWCEKLTDGGSVQHMTVVLAMPGKMLRLNGGLGPLQALAATGAMTFEFVAKDGGTDLTMTYTAGGHTPGGFQALAPLVDGVLKEQFTRLKTAIDK